jgi:hypothetical protein
MDRFRIYLAQQASLIGEHAGQTNEESDRDILADYLFGEPASLAPAILGEVFLDEADIETFHWQEQEMVLTRAVTETMLSNWTEFIKDDEGTPPTGKYPDAEGKTFIVTLGEQRLCIGIIAGIQVLYNPPACPLIYPGLPLTQDGQMVLGIGNPKDRRMRRGLPEDLCRGRTPTLLQQDFRRRDKGAFC